MSTTGTNPREQQHERELLESRRARNREVSNHAADLAAEIQRARVESDEAVERAKRRLREAGVIR